MLNFRCKNLSASILICVLLLAGRSTALSQARTDKPMSSSGHISITVVDSLTNQPTPVRVKIMQQGSTVKILPENVISVMYGLWDHADGYSFQPDSSFYVNGVIDMDLPAGEYSIVLSKGIEYVNQEHTLNVVAATRISKTFSMMRWINMPARGWYAADDHIHIRRSPREDPLLMKWIEAEGINIGVLLKMGDFWATYYDQYAWGDEGVFQKGNYLLTSGQEDPRTPQLGHALSFGASDKVRFENDYYYYDKVFDRLHELGGITGYAHHAESFHGYRGLMLDGLRHKVDMLELLQFCVSEDPLHTQHYYHLLDLGYAVTAVAGSDFPWCGHDHDNGPPERNARIGNARFYSYINEPLSFAPWKQAVKAGHTFVTSGPMLSVRVNGKLPGDTVSIKKNSRIVIHAEADGHKTQVPLQRLEIVRHGKVIATASASEAGQTPSKLVIDKELSVPIGVWVAARAYAGPGQAAHTTPVYISVDNGGFYNPETKLHYLKLAEQYLKELEDELQKKNDDPEHQAWRYRKGLEKRIAETKVVIEQLRVKAR